MINKTFNHYCDESCHLENDGMPYMMLAYTSVAYHQIKTFKERLNFLRNKHNFHTELKWSKVSNSKYGFYDDIMVQNIRKGFLKWIELKGYIGC